MFRNKPRAGNKNFLFCLRWDISKQSRDVLCHVRWCHYFQSNRETKSALDLSPNNLHKRDLFCSKFTFYFTLYVLYSRYNHSVLCLIMDHMEVINRAIKSLQPLWNIQCNIRGLRPVNLNNWRAISLVKLPLNDSVKVLDWWGRGCVTSKH